MKKIFDAVVTTGKYTDRNTGQEKNRYLTIGAVFESDKGMSMKLEAMPVGEFNGWINFYEPRQRSDSTATTSSDPKKATTATDDFDDAEIPF